jgi:hypothetical protein
MSSGCLDRIQLDLAVLATAWADPAAYDAITPRQPGRVVCLSTTPSSL